MSTLDEFRIVACGVMLVLASVSDIRKREIPDKIWLGFGGLGAAIAAYEFLSRMNVDGFNLTVSYLLGVGIITPIAYLIYRTGLYGGADSKALIAIALLMPPYTLANFPTAKIHGFSGLTVLTNAVMLSLAHIAYNIIRNSIDLAKGNRIFEGIEESNPRKALAFAIGFRTNSTKGYLFAMECNDDSGRRKFRFSPARYDEFIGEDLEGKLQVEKTTTVTTNSKATWVTQALPFIVYIAAGFLGMLVVGDFMALLIKSFSTFTLLH